MATVMRMSPSVTREEPPESADAIVAALAFDSPVPVSKESVRSLALAATGIRRRPDIEPSFDRASTWSGPAKDKPRSAGRDPDVLTRQALPAVAWRRTVPIQSTRTGDFRVGRMAGMTSDGDPG